MLTARGCTSTSVVNDKIYVIGGDAGNEPISIVEVYDPATDTGLSGKSESVSLF